MPKALSIDVEVETPVATDFADVVHSRLHLASALHVVEIRVLGDDTLKEVGALVLRHRAAPQTTEPSLPVRLILDVCIEAVFAVDEFHAVNIVECPSASKQT